MQFPVLPEGGEELQVLDLQVEEQEARVGCWLLVKKTHKDCRKPSLR